MKLGNMQSVSLNIDAVDTVPSVRDFSLKPAVFSQSICLLFEPQVKEPHVQRFWCGEVLGFTSFLLLL